jgi:hypothetical protein
MAAETQNSNPAPDTAVTAESGVQTALSGAFSAADGVATLRLQTIARVHQARIARLTRETSALSARGAAGAAALATAQAEIAAQKTTAAKVAMLGQQSATAAPHVAPAGWALHGRVYSSDLVPASGCTVFLVDPQNAYQNAYGFAYTDTSGYFVLNAEAAAPAASAPTATPAVAPPLFVAVADAKGEPVYRSASAFLPRLGFASYQNHVLPPSGKPIGDPPAAIRSTALPKP